MKIHIRSLDDENRPLCETDAFAACDLQLTLAAAEMVAKGTPKARVCDSCRIAYLLHGPEVESGESPEFTGEHAELVLNACAQASWEANALVEIALGRHGAPWMTLDEQKRESWKRQTAACLDVIVDTGEGSVTDTAEKSISLFAAKSGLSPSRSSLCLSVVDAVLNTLGRELKR